MIPGYAYRQKNVRDLDFDGRFARVWSPDIREFPEVLDQLKRLCRLPFVGPYVAVMPDFHPGETALVGSVLPTRDVLAIGAIGGDIGCGMAALELPVDRAAMEGPEERILAALYDRIPVGRGRNREPTDRRDN